MNAKNLIEIINIICEPSCDIRDIGYSETFDTIEILTFSNAVFGKQILDLLTLKVITAIDIICDEGGLIFKLRLQKGIWK